jgi:ESX secretion system protein EccE
MSGGHDAWEVTAMTVNVSAVAGARSAPAPTAQARRRHGTVLGVLGGQIVAAQVALALLVAAAGRGIVAIAAATIAAAAIVTVAWIRVRRRWMYQWLAIAMRYGSRRRALPPQAPAAALLDLVHPGAQVLPAELDHDAAALISDAHGLTAVLELGDPATLLADTVAALPSPTALVPTPAPDLPQVRVQLLVTGAPAPRAGAGTAATSYRQLTEGRLLGQQRAVLAVRVLRTHGWAEPDLRRSLSSLVRKVRRRLGQVPSRPLGEAAAFAVLADLAHHDGAHPAREAWHAIHLGGLLQTTYRLRRWPDLRTETARRLVPRLLTLPAAATTVSISVDSGLSGAELVVRLAAVDPAGLAAASQALRRLLGAEGAGAQRLDGEQLDGFAATLPLGGSVPQSTHASAHPPSPGEIAQLYLPLGGNGLMVGTNRHGAAVTLRLFRPEPTRLVLIGGVRAAQLLALRAMALGARVVVQTSRPYSWEPFVRGVSTPDGTIALVPAGRQVALPPGTPMHPLLLVVDVGPVGTDTGAGWQATMVVRDELAPVDVDALSRADLVVLQPLRPDEAALAAGTLGLSDAQDWLTRIRADMVGVVNRRSVRWALLSATPIEQQLVGTPTR